MADMRNRSSTSSNEDASSIASSILSERNLANTEKNYCGSIADHLDKLDGLIWEAWDLCHYYDAHIQVLENRVALVPKTKGIDTESLLHVEGLSVHSISKDFWKIFDDLNELLHHYILHREERGDLLCEYQSQMRQLAKHLDMINHHTTRVETKFNIPKMRNPPTQNVRWGEPKELTGAELKSMTKSQRPLAANWARAKSRPGRIFKMRERKRCVDLKKIKTWARLQVSQPGQRQPAASSTKEDLNKEDLNALELQISTNERETTNRIADLDTEMTKLLAKMGKLTTFAQQTRQNSLETSANEALGASRRSRSPTRISSAVYASETTKILSRISAVQEERQRASRQLGELSLERCRIQFKKGCMERRN